MTMEKTKDDGQRSAYSDFLKRRDSTMREVLWMADKPIGDPQPSQPPAQTDENPYLGDRLLRGLGSPLHRGL